MINISSEGYINLFNGLAKIFACTYRNEINKLYRIDITSDMYAKEVSQLLDFDNTVVSVYHLSITNEDYHGFDNLIEVVIYKRNKAENELIYGPIFKNRIKLFCDEPKATYVFIDIDIFKDETWGEGKDTTTKCVLTNRVSYFTAMLDGITIGKMYKSTIQKGRCVKKMTKEESCIHKMNVILANCVFNDYLIDKDQRHTVNNIVDQCCATNMYYINIVDSTKAMVYLYEYLSYEDKYTESYEIFPCIDD